MGDFAVRIDILSEQVGGGKITGKVVVDQVYARYQHEGLDLKHPQGGKAMYLRDPLFESHRHTFGEVARQVLEVGTRLPMIEGVERIARGVYQQAPFEFGDLKASPHPTVHDGGTVVYDRPAMVHRLTKEELRVKSHLRSLGLGN